MQIKYNNLFKWHKYTHLRALDHTQIPTNTAHTHRKPNIYDIHLFTETNEARQRVMASKARIHALFYVCILKNKNTKLNWLNAQSSWLYTILSNVS